MYFTNCKVEIIVNEELNLLQRIKWWFEELKIQMKINNRTLNGVTIEEALINSGLVKEGEYLMHLSTYPLKYEIRNKEKDKSRKRHHYIPRVVIFIKYNIDNKEIEKRN